VTAPSTVGGSLLHWLAVTALLAGPAAAQAPDTAGAPDRRHVLALEAAGLRQGLDDAMASPLRYRGTGVAAGAGYEGAGRVWRWDARVVYAANHLTSRLADEQGSYEDGAWVFASAALLRRAGGGGEGGVAVWLGPAVAVELGTRRHMYTGNDWLNFRNTLVALQAAAQAEIGVAGGRVSGVLALPVVGLAVRKEYAGVVGRSPRVVVSAPPSLVLMRQRVQYRTAVKGSLGAAVFLDSTLLRHDDPMDLASISHRLGVSLDWTLGAP
jgi:hypothetical protein